jgi:hypothetical protein
VKQVFAFNISDIVERAILYGNASELDRFDPG